MKKVEKLQYENKGYMHALSSEMEIVKALSDKYKYLAKNSPNSKWKGFSEGFELGYADLLKIRKIELIKAKSRGKGKSKGRTR